MTIQFQEDAFRYAIARLIKLLELIRNKPDMDYIDITKYKDSVLNRYQPIFQPGRILRISEDDFLSFLLYENNHHWNNLHRVGPQITKNMALLRKALAILVDESLPIHERLNRIRPAYMSAFHSMVPYLGVPTLTAILLVAYPQKYGVWNKTSMNGMSELGLWDERWLASPSGGGYVRINTIYQRLCKELNIDLWTLDTLWWVIKKSE